MFLVALCLSIFLEAIQRFVEPQFVSNPRLVLIVGCFGLLSNILGLFLFHEHGHSHGGSGHSHAHGERNDLSVAEEGHSHASTAEVDRHARIVMDEGGNVADVMPESTIGGWPKSMAVQGNSTPEPEAQRKGGPRAFTKTDEDDNTATGTTSPISRRKSVNSGSQRRHKRHASGSRGRFQSVDDIYIHPASFRNEIIAASKLEDIESGTGTDSENEVAIEEEDEHPTEGSPLLGQTKDHGSMNPKSGGKHADHQERRHDSWHISHNHQKKEEPSSGHGHSHSDLNMRGVFLHVMGDALGNIGVIASALIIWLTDYSWRFYSDPAISLIITVIILGSAIPLCRAASRILLQAVPAGISVDDIKEDIEELPGILSCHHLHVWQLSGTKLIASLHVQVEFDFKGEGSARYMQLARAVRHCLHEYGIHSSTIQPEFCLDSEHNHVAETGSDSGNSHTRGQHGSNGSGSKGASKAGSQAPSMRSEPNACLLQCDDECGEGGQCCDPNTEEANGHGEHNHG